MTNPGSHVVVAGANSGGQGLTLGMKFLHPSEVRAACRAFDGGATMRVDQYAALVAECAFPELHYVECQLIDEKGHACRQKFGKGWVARRKDGVEVLVGGRCTQRHFVGAGVESLKQFKADAARLVRQNKLRDAIARFQEFQVNAEFARGLQGLIGRHTALRVQVDAARDALPHAVLERLKRLARGTSRAVPGEVRHIKQVERNGQVIEVSDWRPMSFGVVWNAEIVLLGAVLSIGRALAAAEAARQSDIAPISQDLAALTARLNTLLEVDRVSAELNGAEVSFSEFMQAENWRVLSWLAINEDDQRLVAAKALELAGKPAKPHDAKQAIAQWRQEIRGSNGGRDVRPVQR